MWWKAVNTASVTDHRFFVIKNNQANGLVGGHTTASGYTDIYFVNNADANARHRVTFAASVDTWYHIVFTYNGAGFSTRSNYKLYINGISLTLNAANTFSVGQGVGIELGRQFNGGAQGEKVIDEFALWNNAELSESQVSDLYNGGSGEYANTVESSGLYCYWKLNESGADTTAVDSSGNGNDGTLNNFPASGMWVAH